MVQQAENLSESLHPEPEFIFLDSGNVTAILGNPANLHCSVRVVMERGMAVSLKENLDVTLLLPAGQ